MSQYRRILLKLSGEALAGERDGGLDAERVAGIAQEVAEVVRAGVEVGVVIGGGNFFRGVQSGKHGLDRIRADYMGMLATVMNSLAFEDALEKQGVGARVLTAIEMGPVAERYSRLRALEHLESGRVVIFAGGTSNPFFSTDTAATLRALEIGADLVAKATRVDGVYDKDPHRFPDARRFERITYQQVLEQGLNVMDLTAIAMCRDNKLPLIVFNLNVAGNIMRMVRGQPIGTEVHA